MECFVGAYLVGALFVEFATLILRMDTLCCNVLLFYRGCTGFSWQGISGGALVRIVVRNVGRDLGCW